VVEGQGCCLVSGDMVGPAWTVKELQLAWEKGEGCWLGECYKVRLLRLDAGGAGGGLLEDHGLGVVITVGNRVVCKMTVLWKRWRLR
jgi:hypothetical protein